ncbi:MAG: ATP-binding cassette domain-containing protein [Marmoricola sp.]
MTGAPLLRGEGLRVTYGSVVALDGVTLRASAGEFLAVTGPSGAGKTTLLWTLAGALRPAGGRVLLDGREVGGRGAAAATGVALVPQGNGLATGLTASENVLTPQLALGVPPAEAVRRTGAALDLVGLEESGSHLVEELSGGQQQRVALARAFALQPAVLLADEPTSDLDAVNRARMVALLRTEAARGAVVVMTTHDPEAAAEADREIRLDAGRIRDAD